MIHHTRERILDYTIIIIYCQQSMVSCIHLRPILLLTLLASVQCQDTIMTTPAAYPMGLRVYTANSSSVHLIATLLQKSRLTSFYSNHQSQEVAFSGDDQGTLYMWLINSTTNQVVLSHNISVFTDSQVFGINYSPTTNLITVDGAEGRTTVVNRLNNNSLEILTSSFKFDSELKCNSIGDPAFVWIGGRCLVDCGKKKNSAGIIDYLTCNCTSGYVWNITECVSVQSTFGIPEGTEWSSSSFLLFSAGCQSIVNGVCICPDKYKFDSAIPMCVVNCSNITDSNGDDSILSCKCSDSHRWNVSSPGCDLDCVNIPFSIGFSDDRKSCQCEPGISWNTSSLRCEKDCRAIVNATGTNPTSIDHCSCIPSYSYDEVGSQCLLDCSSKQNVNASAMLTRTSNETVDAGCICSTDYSWDWNDLECKK